MKKYNFTIMMLALGLCACEKNPEMNQEVNQGMNQTVLKVEIPAEFDQMTKAVDIDGTNCTCKFTVEDAVFVFNKTTVCPFGGYLTPTEISEDGKSCRLAGTLTGGTISEGDTLILMSNLTGSVSSIYNGFQNDIEYLYTNKNGSLDGLIDGATATVKVSSYGEDGLLCTESTPTFTNCQSIFRYKFTDENNDAIKVKLVQISSANKCIATYYYPTLGSYTKTILNIIPDSATYDYIYSAMRIDESNSADDVFSFMVRNENGDKFIGTKATPSTGLSNGKFYYNASPIQLTKKYTAVKPTLSSLYYDDFPDPNVFNRYNLNTSECEEFTIKDTSVGYYFYISGSTSMDIGLSQLNATMEDNEFIYSNAPLYINISGTNTITCVNDSQAIFTESDLKLSGNGTLTVTVPDWNTHGLYSKTNYSSYSCDVSAIAAEGSTVTISDRTDNADGTYSWTYTVETPLVVIPG